MEWEFTPEQVVKGEIGYGLAEFRRDLFEEVRANLGADDPVSLQKSYDLIYDLCYWLATGLIKPEWVRKGQIILALTNPNPEIDPEQALSAGAAFAADGKSVNNVLGFPGILRGAVDAYATPISHEMYLAAALAIADQTPPDELVPNPLDKKVHRAVALAVARNAIEQGLARAEFVPYVEE